MDSMVIRQPDDWHIHLRDGAALAHTVSDVAQTFGRAIVMPNLKPPVVTTRDALAYRDRILEHVPEESNFAPLMTLYLTDATAPEEMALAKASGTVVACKLYPAGATTNSDSGVTDLAGMDDVFSAMAEEGLLLLLHGEVTSPDVDIFDRELVFLGEKLAPLLARHPKLKVVLEHITTHAAVEFVRAGPENLAATITPHHLLFHRNHMLVGGIKPHYYCLPILKRASDRAALIEAATSGDPRFFLGTDSAPHARSEKESDCGCAGSYVSPHALELYAEAFDAADALDRLEGFASDFGADFYGLPRNTGTVELVRQRGDVPRELPFGGDVVVPLRAGGRLRWASRMV
jgi:dihydroorotase